MRNNFNYRDLCVDFNRTTIDYNALRGKRLAWLSNAADFSFRNDSQGEGCESFIANLEKHLRYDMKFFTFYNVLTNQMIYTHNVENEKRIFEITGYKENELTIENWNNHIGSLCITYGKDLPHVVRYNNLIYHLMFYGHFNFRVDYDAIITTFRIIRRDGTRITIQRTSSIIELNLSKNMWVQKDEWLYKPSMPELKHVKFDFATNVDWVESGYDLFYRNNLKAIGLNLSNRKICTLIELSQPTLNKVELANYFGVTPKAIDRSIAVIKQKLEDTLNRNGIDNPRLEGLKEIIDASKMLGVLPVPESTKRRALAAEGLER